MTARVIPTTRTTLRQAVCELGASCALMIAVLDAPADRRNRAKERLFNAALHVAWMLLDEDGQAEAWLAENQK